MLLDEISARLTAQSLVTTGFIVREGALTDKQDKVIALYETGGTGPELFGASPPVERPGLQVVVRGAAHDAATPRAQIESIYQAMIGWGAFSSGGVRYLRLTALQAPFPLRVDENERRLYAVNFLVEKELS